MSKWRVFVENKPWLGTKSLHLAREENDGSISVVTDLELTTIGPGKLLPNHDGILGQSHRGEVDDFLRAIMDAAWELGIRPTGFLDHTNELTAVRFHLEDMRKLAKVSKGES